MSVVEVIQQPNVTAFGGEKRQWRFEYMALDWSCKLDFSRCSAKGAASGLLQKSAGREKCRKSAGGALSILTLTGH